MKRSAVTRRQALKHFGAVGAGLALSGSRIVRGQSRDLVVAGRPIEIAVTSVSRSTVRITVLPVAEGRAGAVSVDGALVQESWGRDLARARVPAPLASVRAGDLVVTVTDSPLTIIVKTTAGKTIQRLDLSATSPVVSFVLPNGPLLGLGEGGPQFDRKGAIDPMRNGQGAQVPGERGYTLATHGTRAPVQWLVGTDGWAMFIHQPTGAFDFTGAQGVFTPNQNTGGGPLDVFVVSSNDPVTIMREYARISGLPEMPAQWTFGYLQSHRTLGGPDEIMSVARTFREKKLPCDALIYLGTEFTPSGWNTRNGEFGWNPANFPEPKKMIDEMHDLHFKVVLHIVIEGSRLLGAVSDPCTAPPVPPGRTPDNRWPPERQVSCYWASHKPLADLGIDGWWPDQGDGYDGPSRLNRHRMYWDGSQQFKPNVRPFALHRNASAGIQRYGGFIWSGDVQTRWQTLKTHVPVAINSGLSGFPYWGTDIGGFVPTPEYTGELHVRWFQFGAFCPLFRAHGRAWHLRLPWGWGGEGGPAGDTPFVPVSGELPNLAVEPICRKYLELRYRLMPYLYTAVRETHDTGLPIMRALWLHYPDDAAAVGRGDEFLWGRDMLVAPVVEKGATSRKLYLPRGRWIDFWTEKTVEGGVEIDRAVDLETTPLYVRAGAVIPMGPVKQYTDEVVDAPLTLMVYPGANGTSTWYEDDGKSFDYRTGAFMRVNMTWTDASKRLRLQLAAGSRMLAPNRKIEVRIAGTTTTKPVVFEGKTVDVSL